MFALPPKAAATVAIRLFRFHRPRHASRCSDKSAEIKLKPLGIGVMSSITFVRKMAIKETSLAKLSLRRLDHRIDGT
jgi:hypothetical protein